MCEHPVMSIAIHPVSQLHETKIMCMCINIPVLLLDRPMCIAHTIVYSKFTESYHRVYFSVWDALFTYLQCCGDHKTNLTHTTHPNAVH